MSRPLTGFQAEDAQFIRSPNDWPAWPRLPVKRSTSKGWAELGTIVEQVGHPTPTTVWMVSMFSAIDPMTTARVEYPTPEDAVAAGWMVD